MEADVFLRLNTVEVVDISVSDWPGEIPSRHSDCYWRKVIECTGSDQFAFYWLNSDEPDLGAAYTVEEFAQYAWRVRMQYRCDPDYPMPDVCIGITAPPSGPIVSMAQVFEVADGFVDIGDEE